MSKHLFLAPLLLVLTACGSTPRIADNRTLDCEHGEVEVLVALEGSVIGMDRTEERRTLHVEVSNNSRQDIVVKAIRVDSIPRMRATYQLDNAFRTFNDLIPPNEDREFELPVTGRTVLPEQNRAGASSEAAGMLELAVTVVLEGSATYRCKFLVPAPVS